MEEFLYFPVRNAAWPTQTEAQGLSLVVYNVFQKVRGSKGSRLSAKGKAARYLNGRGDLLLTIQGGEIPRLRKLMAAVSKTVHAFLEDDLVKTHCESDGPVVFGCRDRKLVIEVVMTPVSSGVGEPETEPMHGYWTHVYVVKGDTRVRVPHMGTEVIP